MLVAEVRMWAWCDGLEEVLAVLVGGRCRLQPEHVADARERSELKQIQIPRPLAESTQLFFA